MALGPVVQQTLSDIAGLTALCTLVTGCAIWAIRSAKADMKESVDAAKAAMTAEVDKVLKAMELQTGTIRSEIKDLHQELDRRLTDLNLHMDQKMESVKSNLRDVHGKADKLVDSMHQADKDFLQFKVVLPEQFVTRREMEDIRERLSKIEEK